MSLRSPGIKDGFWEGKLGQILVGVLQDLAGQGLRKDEWVRMTQAVEYLWILMKRAWKDKKKWA
jgi:hypothetical protein